MLTESDIGRSLDDKDRKAIAEAKFRALESAGPSRPVAWQKPGSGLHGQVSAGPSYVVNDRTCRDFAHTIYRKDKPQVLRGTACRNTDATWSDAQ